MAWPLQRYLTFIAQQTPAISAAFLNAVQDALVGLVLGTLTVKALVVDGTGGAAATPTAPAIGTAVPGAAPIRGELARDASPAALGSIHGADCTLIAGFGFHELAKNGVGDYTVTFVRKPTGGLLGRSVILSSSVADLSNKAIDGNGRLTVDISIVGGGDLDFDITAWIF